jgi:aldehyde dehydrogenase (NAD+)
VAPAFEPPSIAFAAQRRAQRKWGETPLYLRLYALRRLRRCLAERAPQLAASISLPGRSEADTVAAEVLPLLDACKFLESEAEEILRTRREPSDLRPFWLRGVHVETRREPHGLVLIIAPSNYPLMLAGIQALQALAAGNAVIWKPGNGGRACATIFEDALEASSMEPALLTVLGEGVQDGRQALETGVDKVIVTGSARTGASVLKHISEQPVDTVMELSGCDSVFVLMDARLDRAVEGLAFGLRFNGSASCMAPRRIFVARQLAVDLEARLVRSLSTVRGIPFPRSTMERLDSLIREATALGARLVYDGRGDRECGPVLLSGVRPDMEIAATDIFAPVLSLMPFRYEEEALEADRLCPYALTVSIFGGEGAARRIAGQVNAGCILINDILATTADPRCAFGGRKRSGYGMTRGREGLLEMTAPKTVLIRRGDDRRHYRLTGNQHADFFYGYIAAVHGEGLGKRWRGWLRTVRGALKLGKIGG